MELFGQQWGGNQAPRCHVKPGTHRKPRGRDGNPSAQSSLHTRAHPRIHPHALQPTCTEMHICTQTRLLAQTRAIINRHTQLYGKNTQNPQPNTESLPKINYKPPEDRKTNTAFKSSNITRHDCTRIIQTTSPEYDGEHTCSFTGKMRAAEQVYSPHRKTIRTYFTLWHLLFPLFLRSQCALPVNISHDDIYSE